MESGPATAETGAADSALDIYQSLSADDVIADLADLGVDELLLVETLEGAGEARAEILDRIEQLLAGFGHGEPGEPGGDEEVPDAHGLETVGPGPDAAVPAPSDVEVQVPAVAPKMLSEDLLEQMGALLARHEMRSSGPVRIPAPAAMATPPTAAAEPLPAVIAPRRGRHSRARLGRPVKVVGGLVLAAAIGVAGFALLGPNDASTGAAASHPASAPTDSLAPRLVATVPGYVAQPDRDDAGPWDLAKAVREDGRADVQQVLTRDGFVAAFQRRWIDASGMGRVFVTVYRFRDAAGARAYAQRAISGARTVRAALRGAVADFPVPGVPGGVGLGSTSPAGASAVAVFTRDTYMVHVLVNAPAPAGETAVAQEVATREYGLV